MTGFYFFLPTDCADLQALLALPGINPGVIHILSFQGNY